MKQGIQSMIRLSLLALIAIATSPAHADNTNLAKYQKAEGSTWGYTLRPHLFATDGIASNFHRWRSFNQNGQWLEITYPRPVTIASAHLYTGVISSTTAENWANFKLQYDNAGTWVDIPGGGRSSNTSLEVNVIFSQSVTSSKFRLLSTDTTSAVRSLREIAMFGPNLVGGVEQGYPIGTGVVLNLAHKRPATASSIDGTNYAIKAVDGYVDDSSRWLCASGTTGQTLEIDLLSTDGNGDGRHAIGSAHLYSGDFATSSDALSDFTLESWDGTTWVVITGATITGNTSTARVIDFSSSVVTTKVRLVNNTTTSAKVAELLIFPPRTGGYPLGQDVKMKAPPTAKTKDFSDATRHLRVSSASLKLGLVNGNAVFTNDAAGSDALNWQLLLNHRDGSYRIRHIKTGHCLALAQLSTAPDTLVIGETYTGMPHQCWILEFVNDTQFRLLNAYSGLALQSLGGSTTPGTALAVVAPGASELQQWDTIWQAHHLKKGLATVGGPFSGDPNQSWMFYMNSLFQHISWSYSWGREDTFPFFSLDQTFNPMQWGNFHWAHQGTTAPLEGDRVYMQSQAKPFSLLGFNEPDGEKQANMTVEQAITRWPRLQSMDAPLVAPCPASPISHPWNGEFYQAVNQLGYRVDYTPLHWYADPNASSLINRIKQLHALYGRPIWLTEFTTVRWGGTATWTHAKNYNFLAEFMWRAENLPELARYSLFNWKHEPLSSIDPAAAPRGNSLDESNNLTIYGELYASWDGVAQVLTQKAYHLHNHGHYQRMQSPASGNSFGFVTPDNSSAGTQWFLVPGTTANTYRIKTTRDGRPLSRTSGNPAAMGTPGQVDTATEWTLVPVVSGVDHDGWYYLQHPLTNQRLKNTGNGTWSMVATTDTTNESRWRFIVPLTPDGGSTAPTLAASAITDNQPGGTVSTNTPITYTLTFSEDIDASSVTAADFGNAGTAAITIGAITEISPGVFTVTITPTTGGTLIFRVNAGAVITDVIGNPLDTTAAIVDETTITVFFVNAPPLWTSNPINETNAMENTAYSTTLADDASDANGDPLTFAKVSGPAWLSVAANGTLSGTPATGNVGANSFTVSVSDGIAPAVTATLNITVQTLGFVDPATAAGTLPVSGGSNWVLTFSDEFNGTTLDTNKWAVDVSTQSRAPRTDRGIADWWWKEENVSIDGNGNLVLTTSKHDSNTMHCGSVSSDGLYEPRYGYLEARIEIADSTRDTHTAFWLQGPNMSNSDPADGTANDGAEVDIFESAWFGDYTKSVVHIDGYGVNHQANTKQYTTPGLHDGYHVFGLEWTPNSMKIYYDGVLKVTYTGIWVPQVAEWLWLSTGASFGDIGDFATSPIGFLTSAKVDYVRVWQYDGNRAPYFVSDPILKGNVTEGTAFSETMAGTALDDDEGDTITYSKVSGPAWLSVAADGTLSGTPTASDAGTNTWVIRATDSQSATATTTLEIAVNALNGPITLVGGNVRNGNFNANPGATVTFASTSFWQNTKGDQTPVATRSDVTFDGSQNAVLNAGRGFGVDTGHVITAGDNFDYSYVWKDDFNWVDATDQVTVSLFVTSDNTITGTRTDLVVNASGLRQVDNTYESVSRENFYTATAAVAGKTLFAAIETTSTGFARFDNVVLTVTANQAPVFTANPINRAAATEGSPYAATLAGSATDPESNPLTFAKVSGPAWLSVAANGALTGTPSNSDVGANSFTVSVSDGSADHVEATLNINVLEAPESYIVSFDANGGSAADPLSKEVISGGTYSTLPSTTRSGYTFIGWFTASSAGTQVTDATVVTATADHTLYAQWSAIYTVSYNGNDNTGGTTPGNQDKLHGVNLPLATNSGNLTKTGFSFVGWNTASNGSGTDYPAGSTYTANAAITLYAKWVSGVDGTWLPTTAGPFNWGDGANWSGGNIASGSDATALFTPNITAAQVANLDVPRTIGDITFTDSTTSSHNLTISGANILTLSRSSGAPRIDVTQSTRTLTISSQISGSSGLQKNGAGTLTLSGANDYSGGTILNGGTLATTSDANLGSGGGITVNGTSTWSLSPGTYNRAVTMNNDAALTVAGSNGAKTITGVLSGSGALLNGTTTTYEFSNPNNSFSGTVNSGYGMYFANIGDSSNAFNLVRASNAGGNFYWTGGEKIFALRPLTLDNTNSGTFHNNGSGAVTFQQALAISGTAGARTLGLSGTYTGAPNTFSGNIADGVGSVVGFSKSGNGTWQLANANTYTGPTTVTGGTLSISRIANLGSPSSIGAAASGAIILGSGGTTGTLLYTGDGDESNRTFQVNSSVNTNTGGAAIINNGTGALTFTASPFNNAYTIANSNTRMLTFGGTNGGTINGVIQDNSATSLVGIGKTGTGTWTLKNTNTNTGASSATGGGNLILDYTSTHSKLSDTAALTLGGGTITLKGGAHTEIVGSAAISTGASFITRDGGTSVLQMNALTRTGAGTIRFLDGTVATTDTANTNGILGGWATIGNDWAINSTDGPDGPITALPSGSYTALPPSGTGSNTTNYTLSGGQLQTGTATLAAHTVKLEGSGETDNTLALGATNINLTTVSYSGGILYVGGGTGIYNVTADAGKGITIATHNRDLIITTVTGTLNISAKINSASARGLVKSGAGTLVLSSSENAYTRTTYVNEGTLALVGGSLASPIIVASGASLGFTIGSPATSSSSVDLSSGTVTITGTPTLASYTLMTASGGFTGTPVLSSPVPGYEFTIEGTELKLLNTQNNSAPVWSNNTITGSNAIENVAYSGSISSYATDPNNDPLTFAKVSGPAWLSVAANGTLSGTPTSSDVGANAFTVSVSDGIAAPVVATLNITVITAYETWATVEGLTGNDALPGADPDGDGITNFMEFALGMNPTLSSLGQLEFISGGEVTKPGLPVLMNAPQGNPPFQAVYGRRKNHVAAGLVYEVEFSSNLIFWTVSNDGMAVLSGEGDHEIEVVSVPFPANVPLSEGGQEQLPPRFFRLSVSNAQP